MPALEGLPPLVAPGAGTAEPDPLELAPLPDAPALEPLGPTDAAVAPPMDLTATQVAAAEPWYMTWWAWGGAGAIVVSGVVTAVMLSQDDGSSGAQYDAAFKLCGSDCGAWDSD